MKASSKTKRISRLRQRRRSSQSLLALALVLCLSACDTSSPTKQESTPTPEVNATQDVGATKEDIPQYIKATKEGEIEVNALYPPVASFLAADTNETLYFLAIDSAQLIRIDKQGQTVVDLVENAKDDFSSYFDGATPYSKNYSLMPTFAYNERSQQFFVCIYQPIHTGQSCCVAAYDLDGKLLWKREGEAFAQCIPWEEGCAYVSGKLLLLVDGNGDTVSQVQLPRENLVIEGINDQLISLFDNPFMYAFVEQAKVELAQDGQILRETKGLCSSLDALALSQNNSGTYLVGRDESGYMNVYLQHSDGTLDLYQAITFPQNRHFRPTATVSLGDRYGVFVTEYTLDDTTDVNVGKTVGNDVSHSSFLLLMDDQFNFLNLIPLSLPAGQVAVYARPCSNGIEVYAANSGAEQDHFLDRTMSMQQEYLALSHYLLEFQ